MRVISIVNQKGGCGKTTTAVNLAGALAADGARVLVVDMDPQAHATLAFGIDPDETHENLFDVLAEPTQETQLAGILIPVLERIDVAPSSVILSALEQKLAAERDDDRTERLSRALAALPSHYDFVLIDCPPAVSLLTFNALRASREVIVPLETSIFAVDGVQKLLETLTLLMDRIGHDLTVRVLPTLYDGRTRYARETLGEIRELFKDLCFDSVIRMNIKLREAARRGVPINVHAPRANGTLDYAATAIELAACPPAELQVETTPRDASSPSSEPREVVIRFRDADAADVRIAGDFNGWIPDRDVQSRIESQGPERVWTKVLLLPPGTYEYRYVVDGEWCTDPENLDQTPGPMGQPNSVLHVR
ncbi:MAG: AAA family ATPase [Myxococcota bacterium]|nr:AAA family ATPase [Myxococcota bacterium]